jgi:hypothetical protein
VPLLPVIGTKWIEPNLNCVEFVGLENECDLSARNCCADAHTGSLDVRHRAVVHGAPSIEGSYTLGPILDREVLAFAPLGIRLSALKPVIKYLIRLPFLPCTKPFGRGRA